MNQPVNVNQITLHRNGGMTIVGPDAIKLQGVITLRAAINLYIKIKMIPTRGVTISVMLKSASSVTGKSYKNNEAGWKAAVADLTTWIEANKASVPVEDNRAAA